MEKNTGISHILEYSWDNINDLHNILQNLHSKIEFTIVYNFKEPAFLDEPVKIKNGQIYLRHTDTNNISISTAVTPNLHKIHSLHPGM